MRKQKRLIRRRNIDDTFDRFSGQSADRHLAEREIRAIDRIGRYRRRKRQIHRRQCLLDMELPRQTIRPYTPPVVEAKCSRTRLLNLVYACALADCMDESTRDEVAFANLRLMANEDILERTVLHGPLNIRRRRPRLYTREERPSLENAPHLSLWVATYRLRRNVVRMHLNAKAVIRDNLLYENARCVYKPLLMTPKRRVDLSRQLLHENLAPSILRTCIFPYLFVAQVRTNCPWPSRHRQLPSNRVA